MDTKQAIREIVKASGLTHRQIAHRLGKYDTYVSQITSRATTPGCDDMAALARACGYRLDLVPMDGGATITIGDGYATDADAPTIDKARAMIARGLAMLDQATTDK